MEEEPTKSLTLGDLLGEDIANQIPETLRGLILEKVKQLQASILQEKGFAQMKEELSSKVTEVEELRANLDETRYFLSNVQEKNSSLTAEKEEISREKDQMSAEKQSFEDKSIKRQEDFDKLMQDHKSVIEELSKAKSAKCEALCRIQDLESREVAVQKQEARLAEERELLQLKISSLSEDLHESKQNSFASQLKSERRISELSQELKTRSESLSKLEAESELLAQDRDVLRSRLETVIARLDEAKTEMGQKEQAFKKEILAQTKLAEVYKGQAEVAEERFECLEKSLVEYQARLKEEQIRYGALENLYERDMRDQKDELSLRNETVQELEGKLKDANNTLNEIKKKGLTEEGIAQLAPAAAEACKLIKSDMSLTQIYSQLVSCKEDQLRLESENRSLKSQIEEIYSDIRERIPGFKRQKTEFERNAMELKSTIQELEKEKEEHKKSKSEVKYFKEKLPALTLENTNLKKQVENLSLQVRALLHDQAEASGENVDESVTFRNIDELQEMNTKLMGLVQDMKAEREDAEIHIIEEKTQQLKHRIEMLTSQVSLLQDENRMMNTNYQSVVLQKEALQTMLDNAKNFATILEPQMAATSTPKTTPPLPAEASGLKLRDLEARSLKAEAALEELQQEFEEYKEDKAENEKILLEQFEKTKEMLLEYRRKKSQNDSVSDWNSDKDRLSDSQLSFYKKEIEHLEKLTKDLRHIIEKHENTIAKLHEYSMDMNSKFSTTERSLVRAEMELKRLRNNETRLTKERDLLQKQKLSISMVTSNLQLIQNQLEGADHIKKMQLQNEVDALRNQLEYFKGKTQSDEELLRAEIKNWEGKAQSLTLQVKQLTEKETQAKSRNEELSNELESLKEQLKMVQGSPNLAAEVTGPKITELQAQIRTLKNEMVTLKNQLSALRQESSKHKTQADESEKKISELTKELKDAKEQNEKLATERNQERASLNAKISELTLEKNTLSQRLSSLGVSTDPGLKAQKELVVVKAELEQRVRELNNNRQIISKLEQEVIDKSNLSMENKSLYEMQVVKCGETTKTVRELRDKIARLQQDKGRVESEKLESVSFIETQKMSIVRLEEQIASLKSELKVAAEENEALLDQLSNRTHNASLFEMSGASNISLTGLEDHPDRLMDIINRLRKEKEILKAKVEVFESRSERTEGEIQNFKKELKQMRRHSSLPDINSPIDSELPSAKFKEVFDRSKLVPALTEANHALRSENEKLQTEIQEVKNKLAQMESLRLKLKVMEEKEEKYTQEIKSLSAEIKDLKQKVVQLTELNKKLNPEELKRLEGENARLTKQVSLMQGTMRQQSNNVVALNNKVNALEAKLSGKEAELAKVTQELQSVKAAQQMVIQKANNAIKKAHETEAILKQTQAEREQLKTQIETLKATSNQDKEELKKLTDSLQQKEAALKEKENLHSKTLETIQAKDAAIKDKEDQLNASRTQLNKLRGIGRSFKEKSETLEKENKDLAATVEKLKADLAKNEDANKEQPSEMEALLEQSANQIVELEEKIANVEEENKKLKESGQAKEEKAKSIMVQLRAKMTEQKTEFDKIQKQLRETSTETQKLKIENSNLVATLNAEKKNLQEEKEKLVKQVEQLTNEAQVTREALVRRDEPVKPQPEIETGNIVSVQATTLNPEAPEFKPQAIPQLIPISVPVQTFEDPTTGQLSVGQLSVGQLSVDPTEIQISAEQELVLVSAEPSTSGSQPLKRQLDEDIPISEPTKRSRVEVEAPTADEILLISEDDDEADEDQVKQIERAITIVDNEDQDEREVEISMEDDEAADDAGSNHDQRPQENVLDSEDEEPLLHLAEEEEVDMPSQPDDGSRGSAAVVPEMASRSSSAHDISTNVQSSLRSHSPEQAPSVQEVSIDQQQQVPIGSVAIEGTQPFEDATDDSVVPSTPKLVPTQGGRLAPGGFSGSQSADPRFVFGANVNEPDDDSMLGPEVGHDSAEASDLVSQGGLDSTAVDISQFTEDTSNSANEPQMVPVSEPEPVQQPSIEISDEIMEVINVSNPVNVLVSEPLDLDGADAIVNLEEGEIEVVAGPSQLLEDVTPTSEPTQPQRVARPPKLSRTPIIWTSPTSSASGGATSSAPEQPQQPRPPASGRGGTAKRARGLPFHHLGRGRGGAS